MSDPITAFTAAVKKARDAYRSDEAVRAGICATCLRRRTNGTSRRCWGCINEDKEAGK